MLVVNEIGSLINGLCENCGETEAELAVYSSNTAVCCECETLVSL